MSDQQTCPHCGVEKHFVYPDFFYKCNTPVRESKRRTYKCYERQLSAKDAEIESLKQALIDSKRAVQTWAYYPEVK